MRSGNRVTANPTPNATDRPLRGAGLLWISELSVPLIGQQGVTAQPGLIELDGESVLRVDSTTLTSGYGGNLWAARPFDSLTPTGAETA